jgi:inosine-uridine nucleoside N-ribohydrolase
LTLLIRISFNRGEMMTHTKSAKRLTARTMIVASMLAITATAGPHLFASAQTPASIAAVPEKVIIDTDIGDDVDDAFALALALSSNQVQILGVTTAWGDTDLRARLAERFLRQTDHGNIPIASGPKTASGAPFTQAAWAKTFPEPPKGWPNAIGFILDTIRRNPGQITLISLAPLSNVGALIERDPETFRKLKRVVMMGGSIRQGYGDLGYLPDHGADAEYNIKMDIPAAKELFASGVPIDMMPLDSTQLKLDEVMRATLFKQPTPSTEALGELYQQWASFPPNLTPTLYDAMAVGVVIDPGLCPTTPMHLRIDDAGFTRVEPGPPNANVCLHSDADQFFHFYIPKVLGEHISHLKN